MRNMLAVITSGSVLAFALGTAQAELLSNGDLDRVHAVEIVPGFSLPKPDVWFRSEFRSTSGPYEDGMSSEPWSGPAPTPVTANGLSNPAPYNSDPDWGVFFKAFTGAVGNTANAHLYQDVAGSAGTIYTLTGWAGGEANFMGGAELAVEFLDSANVVIGGETLDLGLEGLLVPNGQPFNYKQYSVSALAPAGTVLVRSRVSMIGGIANPAGGGQAFVVDDLSLVPEPTTALLLIGGALLLRRR